MMRRTTSDAAWASVADSLQAKQAAVLRALRAARKPLTDEALQALTGLNGNCERPRRGELVAMGLIKPAGYARTRSGCRALTWVASEAKP